MRVIDVMTTPVRTISSDTDGDEAFAIMQRHRIHHLVVTQGRAIVGVLSDRDLGSRKGAALRAGREVQELMTPAPVVAEPGMTIRSAANLLRGRSIGCLPVMDGAKLVGLITAADLLELVGRGGARNERAATTRASRRFQRRPVTNGRQASR